MTDDEIETSIITDPYRPPIRETTPNNLPFIIERRKKFPAGEGGLSSVSCGKTVKTHI